MAALTDIYVNPAIAANSGTGTSIDPYGDLQYALNTATRDSTNGNRILIKSVTDEILAAALSLTTFGNPAATSPLVFQGYASTPGDSDLAAGTGIAGIDGNGGSCWSTGRPYVFWRHCRLHNCGSSTIYTGSATGGTPNDFFECEFDTTTGSGIVVGAGSLRVVGCYLHSIGNLGIDHAAGLVGVYDSYFANGANSFVAAIASSAQDYADIHRNIISISGASDGIRFRGMYVVAGNSILSAGGTGQGIQSLTAGSQYGTTIRDNLIDGFSGVGGVGLDFPSGPTSIPAVYNNSIYNCTTIASDNGSRRWIDQGNETLSASPFKKSGSDTFANRYTYFAPSDAGLILRGAYPSGSGRDRGAAQLIRAVNFIHGLAR